MPKAAPRMSACCDPLPETPVEAVAHDDQAVTGEPPTYLGGSSSGDSDMVTWISWRFTTPFEQRIRELFDGKSTYLAVYEVSKTGVEHWHVVTIGHKDHDRVKQHIHRRESMKGMKWWSKKNSGTFQKAVSYTMKTVDCLDNQRFIKSDDWPEVQYERWVFQKQATIAQPAEAGQEPPPKKPRAERDWQLTYSNLVCQAVKFHRERGLPTSTTLRQCVKKMMAETKWRPCNQMYKCGVLVAYEEDFKFRIGQSKEPYMKWWAPSGHGE